VVLLLILIYFSTLDTQREKPERNCRIENEAHNSHHFHWLYGDATSALAASFYSVLFRILGPFGGVGGLLQDGGARAGVRHRFNGLRRRPHLLLGGQDLPQVLGLHDHGHPVTV